MFLLPNERIVHTGLMAPVCADLEPLLLRGGEIYEADRLRFVIANIQEQIVTILVEKGPFEFYVAKNSPRNAIILSGPAKGYVALQTTRKDGGEFLFARGLQNSYAQKISAAIADIREIDITPSPLPLFFKDMLWDPEYFCRKTPRNIGRTQVLPPLKSP